MTDSAARSNDLAQLRAVGELGECSETAIHDALAPFVAVGEDGRVIYANRSCCELVGVGLAELIGRRFVEFAPMATRAMAEREFLEWMSLPDPPTTPRELKLRRPDGKDLILLQSTRPCRLADGRRVALATLIDITSRKRDARVALEKALSLQDAIFNAADYSLIVTDTKGIVRYFNAAAERMLGYCAAEVVGREAVGRFHDPDEVRKRAAELSIELGYPVQARDAMVARLRAGIADESKWTYVRKDDSRLPVMLSITGIYDAGGELTGVLGIANDITARLRAEAELEDAQRSLEQRVAERTLELEATNRLLRTEIDERRQIEGRLRFLAHHDALTGLPNRNLLHDRLSGAIRESGAMGTPVAVMLLDLDRFKSINDTLGHAIGDELLCDVGARLTGVLGTGDILGRLGGDEFVLVFPALRPDEDLAAVAERLIETLQPAFHVQNYELHVSTSVGICVFPQDGADAATLLMNADTAMYQAKAGGRNGYQFFTAELNRRAARHYELESALRHAIARDELRLNYQPLVDGATGRLSGMEVLLRWHHPTMGMVPPVQFIPVAEETGLIVPIGEWGLRAACAQLRRWLDRGYPRLPLSINISGVQFRMKSLCDVIVGILVDYDLSPDMLELELTESSLIHDSTVTMEMLARLTSMGVRIAIDDFGTGYSSLAYLKRFPVSKLKIDQSFVRDLDRNPGDLAIVNAVIALAQALDLEVLAEGVETATHLRMLLAAGCGMFQGYLFSRPVPAVEAERFFDLDFTVHTDPVPDDEP